MSRYRTAVLDWFEAGRVVPGREAEVLRAADIAPSPAEWRGFLAQLTLWLGTIALACAVIFFFAFNWDDLGRFAKFGLIEAAILAALAALWWLGLDRPAGKAVLLLLSLLTGALLALTGQVYQTGADTYELFGWWAVLILPWVLVSRFSPLWLFWLALLNVAAMLYFQLYRDVAPLLWALFALNGAALAAWEVARQAGVKWLQDDWPPRLVAIASGVMATALIVWAIVVAGEREGPDALPALLAYLGWLAAFYHRYRRTRPDLFMLAGGVLSLIVAIVVFLAQHILDGGPGAYLIIGLAVIGLSAGGAFWLKSAAREQTA